MTIGDSIQTVRTELEKGIQLAKCQKCGCMRETLDHLVALLPAVGRDDTGALAESVARWTGQMQPVQYACLGCEHCYPAVAQNELAVAFPSVGQTLALSCDFQVSTDGWPPIVGEYVVVEKNAAVAVSTLASVQLAEALANQRPHGLAIIGKTETENIGIDKVIKNIITNPAIQYLIVAGQESKGHQAGKTLLALSENGVDSSGQVIGSPGKRPILRNVSTEEIRAFREQVQLIDMIGCDNPREIGLQVEELSSKVGVSYGCCACEEQATPVSISTAPTIVVSEPAGVIKMDKAGYFVIAPLAERGVINVEHYAYDNTLLRIIEGTSARLLYITIISNGWATELSHAAYLGKELAKAELSLEHGFKYIQEGA